MAVKPSKKGVQPQPTVWKPISRWSILLFLFAFILNADTLRYQFTYDDPLVVSQNKFVDQGWTALPEIFTTASLEGYNGQKESNYRPFSIGQFAIERSVFGTGPGGFHFMHLLYYALGCVMVFHLLILIFKDYPIWLPIGVAALFIAHPLHTEVVANLKSRDEITSLIGIVGTLLVLLKTGPFTIKSAVLVFFSSCMAFFSKESALSLILAAPITIYYFNPGGLKSNLRALIVIGLAASIYLVMRQYVAEVPGPNFRLEDNALFVFEYPERLIAAIALIAHYAWIFLFPVILRADYSFDQLQLSGWSDPWSYAGLLVLGVILYWIIKGLKSKSIAGYAATFSVLFYVVTSNLLVMTGATLAERFMFIPSLGLLMLIGTFIFELYKKQKISESRMIAILIVVTALYSIRTFTRNPVWRDNPNLFGVTAQNSPRSIRALTNLASIKYESAMRLGNPVTRARLCNEALTYLDASMAIYGQYAQTHITYGNIQREQKKYPLSIESIRKAIAINPADGSFDFSLALTYVLTNEDSLALASFQQASDKGLNNISFYDEWAKLYLKRKQFNEAIQTYKKMMVIPAGKRFALSQITKIYRDQLDDVEQAMFYNEQLKKVVEAEIRK